MAFCAECGKTIPKNAKFCPGCGAKVITELVEELGELFDDKTDTNEDIEELSKLFDDKIQDAEIIEEKKDEAPILEFVEKEKWDDLKGLHKFFTKPYFKGNFDKSSTYSDEINNIENAVESHKNDWTLSVVTAGCGGFALWFYIAQLESTEMGLGFEALMGQCFSLFFLIATIMAASALYSEKNIVKGKANKLSELEAKRKKTDRAAINEMREEKEWLEMSPVPLFKRLEEAQEMVAKSSYGNLGIDGKNTTRPPAYCYGPHLEVFGDIFGERTDQTGIGKGADYYKFCEKKGLEGLYTREYDMMVVQFTENQIMVYKCIFDVLEMTKRLEESYEWNYKHVVGINITGDEKEKDLGGGIAVTGTKYLVISAASGDKIQIVLGAGTRKVDSSDGKEKRTSLGGEERIYEVANEAMKSIREAVRKGAK